MKWFSIFPNSLSFRMAMLFYVIAPLIIAAGLFAYLPLNSIEKQVENQMKKDLELVARAVQLPLSYSLEKERMGSIKQTLDSVFSIGRVYSAYVFNKEGEEIIRIGQADPNPKTDRLIQLASDGVKQGEYGQVAEQEVFSYFVPLTDTGGQITGLLQLTRRKREFSENLQSIRIKGALFFGLLLIMLSIVVLFGHHRALGMHLDRLNSTISKIARGERKHRFSCTGPKELNTIGQNFNFMLDRIDDAEKAVIEQRKKQKYLEKKLHKTEKLAALGRLSAGTAHELGTPLSVINGRAQRALRDKDISESQRRSLYEIREEVSRMEYIIKQLLDFTRRNPVRPSAVNPSQLAASAIHTIKDEAENNRTKIDYSGQQIKRPLMVDITRIHQALINLLRNAIQCTRGGRIHLSWLQDTYGVLFRVDDSGPGVDPAIRANIFEPFYTTKKAGEGTGLGLSVVQTIVEEHGGSINVQDSELGGASFELIIPWDFTMQKDHA